MSDARDEILGRIRAAVSDGRPDAARADAASRLETHPRNLVPARARDLGAEARENLFVTMAEEADATVARVAVGGDVPREIARYLAERNLPARLVAAPDPKLENLPWQETALELRHGIAADDDAVGVTASFAAIAETGTLMLVSGPASPTRNNFLPETHVVVLRAADVVGTYEEAWERLRAARAMPRIVNFITGPSRTGDIAQKLELGAHGPRRLHIVLVEDGA
ncbi:MAG TPA: LUD domain-containing protein [Stellaceae bacterium]|nr:LUD domain-containing protein [Stellaceae bacterium]